MASTKFEWCARTDYSRCALTPSGSPFGIAGPPSLETGTVAHEKASNATFSLRCPSIVVRPVCIIHTMQSRELIKLLQADGWQLQRTRGSHHQFVHPTKPGTVTVPHPKKDLGKGLVRAIRKQAGLR